MLKSIREQTLHLKYGREALCELALAALAGADSPRILDLGVSWGTDLTNIRSALAGPCHLYGVEYVPEAIQVCHTRGIQAAPTDLEQEPLPYGDGYFDLVISNQTYEHLKNIFWCTAEVIRVLKPGGHFVIGVPNLASPHCSLPLLLGKQPRQIKVHGPHVRGFTLDGLKDLLITDGYFTVKAHTGSGFYPFPRPLAIRLAQWLPTYATSVFASFQRTPKPGSFMAEFRQRYQYQTSYFLGTEPSPPDVASATPS